MLRFLDSMSAGWNISLFHYRNHGADYGRVLVGMQVPPADKRKFRHFLDRLGYDYVDESANAAYRMFLGRGSEPAPVAISVGAGTSSSRSRGPARR
jgi:threonine dehydratase